MRWIVGGVVALVIVGLFVPAVSARGGGSSGGRPSGGIVSVRPHVTRKGSLVPGHQRTSPNSTKADNWSTRDHINPFTGKQGSRNPW